MTGKGITSVQGRDILGIGGSINTHHEGPTMKRPTEQALVTGEEKGWNPRKKTIGEVPMNNPVFGMSPSEKKA